MRGLGLFLAVWVGGGCGDEVRVDPRDAVEVDSANDADLVDSLEDLGGDTGDLVEVESDLEVSVPDGEDAPEDALRETSSDAEDDSGDDAGDDTSDDTAPDLSDTPDSTNPPEVTDTSDTGPDVSDTGPDPDPYAGLVDSALRSVLRAEATLGHTPLGYNAARDAMYAVGGLDDVGGRIECIYTGRTVDATGSRTPNRNCKKADGTPISCAFNTEHTWARYYLRSALTEGSPAYNAAESDIHQLRPTDDDVNNARWHFDFGETDCPEGGACKLSEGSELGQRQGVTGYANCPTGNLSLSHVCVMEVRPARRGEIARGMFYMAVRYGMAMDDTMEEVLRQWNRLDPPDARERTRNDAAHAAQGNRNVFIDRPDLVERMSDF